MQGDHLEAQQITAVLDAGRNRRFLDATGGDLQGPSVRPQDPRPSGQRLFVNGHTTVSTPHLPIDFGISDRDQELMMGICTIG